MANTKQSRFNIWILAAAALVAPAVMSMRSQAQPTQTEAEAAAEMDAIDSGPQAYCPLHCLNDSACTIGCQTAALCISRTCIAL